MGGQGGGIISSALQLIKEKERQGDKAVVEKEKVKEPEKEEATTDTPTAPGADKEEQEKDVANLGIIDLAKQATSK